MKKSILDKLDLLVVVVGELGYDHCFSESCCDMLIRMRMLIISDKYLNLYYCYLIIIDNIFLTKIHI
jgi:hypothetical protein